MADESKKQIVIKGAREHNLQDIDVSVPRDEFIVITGLSGSGKSSLAKICGVIVSLCKAIFRANEKTGNGIN